MPARSVLDEDAIRSWYTDYGISSVAIAKFLGASRDTVMNRIKRRQFPRASFEIRFWQNAVPQANGCYLWKGYKHPEHARPIVNRGGKMTLAAHLAFNFVKGPIPNGLLLRRSCDMQTCINPEHLLLGNKADNANDAYERGQIPWGDRKRATKVTDIQALLLRAARQNGTLNRRAAAAALGVAYSTVANIVGQKGRAVFQRGNCGKGIHLRADTAQG